MLGRALTALVCADVWDRSQHKSGVTLCSRPKDTALMAIKFHAFNGVSKGDLCNGCTIVSGARVILATATVSDAAFTSGSLGANGPVTARAASSSVAVGVTTSWTDNQSSWTSTVVGRIRRRSFRGNTRTAPSSGVAHVNDGIM